MIRNVFVLFGVEFTNALEIVKPQTKNRTGLRFVQVNQYREYRIYNINTIHINRLVFTLIIGSVTLNPNLL